MMLIFIYRYNIYGGKILIIINDIFDYEFLNIGSYYECLLSHVYYAFFT